MGRRRPEAAEPTAARGAPTTIWRGPTAVAPAPRRRRPPRLRPGRGSPPAHRLQPLRPRLPRGGRRRPRHGRAGRRRHRAPRRPEAPPPLLLTAASGRPFRRAGHLRAAGPGRAGAPPPVPRGTFLGHAPCFPAACNRAGGRAGSGAPPGPTASPTARVRTSDPCTTIAPTPSGFLPHTAGLRGGAQGATAPGNGSVTVGRTSRALGAGPAPVTKPPTRLAEPSWRSAR